MNLATRLMSGAVIASTAFAAVPASALSLDVFSSSHPSSQAHDSSANAAASARVQAKTERDSLRAESSLRGNILTQGRANGRRLGWLKDLKNDWKKNWQDSWRSGTGSTMTGSGRVIVAHEANINTSLQAAATLSARLSHQICKLMGEEGTSFSTCMNSRKEKIKMSFNAMIDAAFTASVSTEND